MIPRAPVSGERASGATRRTRRAAAAWVVTVLALGAVAQSATAAVERSDSVLVRVDPSATAPERADVRRALDAERVRPLVAGWRAYELSGEVTLAEARRMLAPEGAAEAVALDARLHPSETPDDAHFGSQWALPALGAPAAWDLTQGAGEVVVSVIDTGVQTAHPDLAGRLWQNPGEIAGNGIDDDGNGYVDDVSGWNFFDESNVIYSAADGDSHGTHVAGTIGARRANAIGIAGVADNVRIMPLKFLKPGGGYTSDAIIAIQYAVGEGAAIINASWGGETYSQPLCDAIALAGDAGVLVVAAAGNGGDDAIGDDNDTGPAWPANCPASNLVSVAATTPSDGLASFSNYGALSVDLGAPGEDVLSLVPHLTYGYKSGTSMAAPHVTGVAAQVLGMHPELTPWQLRTALMAGGDPVPALAGTTVSGRRVSLIGALAAAGTGAAPDVTPPDAFSVLSPADGAMTTAPAPVFTWAPSSDSQSGVVAYRLAVNGAVVATAGPSARSAVPSGPLPEGVHGWTVSAVDGAGNVRSTPSRTLVVDRSAPSVPALRSPAPAARLRGPAVDLAWAPAQDAVSGVAAYRVIVDGVAVATLPASAGSARVTLATGTHSWQVVAVDALGHQATSPSRAVTVTGAIPALATPAAPRRLVLSAPSRLASGRVPQLRVRMPVARRVVVSVRRGSRAKPIATFRMGARAGVTVVRFPRRVTRKMRVRGTYVVTARATASLRDSVRITVGPARRR